ncbi:TetR family transcriptional regulator [Streptomyces sp. CC53]|uniref:TetR/AcrR family transcriptional regulator n=1 Tax=unclassified Streptomyces TaxID=2593676 RepID=UPI0008DCDB06|nr:MULTISPECIES: TetR/AcrR family transcriptional regulator [unclassified Streptomyces]OII65635.1 TetR family transcriptional regulator [Streptomyces sp. CC53]OII69778.1 TetR family transcriptional regulator [Streptomyces sp. CC77]
MTTNRAPRMISAAPSVQGARARARAEITAAIKDEARRQLAAEGAAKLSLRAVARALGMVSSALYRYFPSRDDLLTALIVDAYDALGAAAEAALEATPPTADPVARWTAVCAAARSWAVAHPHEYALLYGSPVPGYTAPRDTVAPAARVALALVAVVRDAHRAGAVAPPPLPAALGAEARRMTAGLTAGAGAGDHLPPALVHALVGAWAQLFGLISFEVFGHFHGVVEERETFFHAAAARIGREVGLRGDAD